jgi:hypothetical protein
MRKRSITSTDELCETGAVLRGKEDIFAMIAAEDRMVLTAFAVKGRRYGHPRVSTGPMMNVEMSLRARGSRFHSPIQKRKYCGSCGSADRVFVDSDEASLCPTASALLKNARCVIGTGNCFQNLLV